MTDTDYVEEEEEDSQVNYDFSLLDKISEEDLSDVEGDALEDFGFNETNQPFTSRFENSLVFQWKIEDFQAVQEAMMEKYKSFQKETSRRASNAASFRRITTVLPNVITEDEEEEAQTEQPADKKPALNQNQEQEQEQEQEPEQRLETVTRIIGDIHSFEKKTLFRNLSVQSPSMAKLGASAELTEQNHEQKPARKKGKEEMIQWKLLLYPSGHPCAEPPALQNHISIYLAIANIDELPPGFLVTCKVDFVVLRPGRRHSTTELVDHDNKTASQSAKPPRVVKLDPERDFFQSCENNFSKETSDWGFPHFLPTNKLPKLLGGKDKSTLTIVCRVRQKHNVPTKDVYDSRNATGKVGLRNLGATCYLNSLLQTLFFTKRFRLAVYQIETRYHDRFSVVSASHNDNQVEGKANGMHVDSDSLDIVESMQRLFFELEVSAEAVDTKRLTRSFGWTSFELFMQHDVQELNRQLCDKLEIRFKETSDAADAAAPPDKRKNRETGDSDNIIKSLFMGTYRSFIKCLDIEYESAKLEEYYDLQLDVKGMKNVYHSLDNFVKVEKLEGENQYYAEQHGKQDAEKGIQFMSFPKVLNLHLKRFQYNVMRDMTEKINDKYEFSFVLDLDRYVQKGKEMPERLDSIYVLHSVLVHSGNVNAGHYYAFINSFDKLSNKKLQGIHDLEEISDYLKRASTWHKFDDESVVRVKQRRAMDATFGGSIRRHSIHNNLDIPNSQELNGFGDQVGDSSTVLKCTNAYMLVYMKISELEYILPETPSNEMIGKTFVSNMNREIKEELEVRRKKLEAKEKVRVFLFVDKDIAAIDGAGEVDGLSRYFVATDYHDREGFQYPSFTVDFVDVTRPRLQIAIRQTASLRDLYAAVSKCLPNSSDTSKFRLWLISKREINSFRVERVLERTSPVSLKDMIRVNDFNFLSHKADGTYEFLDNQIYLYVELFAQHKADSGKRKAVSQLVLSKVPKAKRLNVEEPGGSEDDSSHDSEFRETASSPLPAKQPAVDISEEEDDTVELSKSKHWALLFVKLYVFDHEQQREKMKYLGSMLVNLERTFNDFVKMCIKNFDLDPSMKYAVFEQHSPKNLESHELHVGIKNKEVDCGDILILEQQEKTSDKDMGATKRPQRASLDEFLCRAAYVRKMCFVCLDSSGEVDESVRFTKDVDIRMNYQLVKKMLIQYLTTAFHERFNKTICKDVLLYTSPNTDPLLEFLKSMEKLPIFDATAFKTKTLYLYFQPLPFVYNSEIATNVSVRYKFEEVVQSMQVVLRSTDTIQTLKEKIKQELKATYAEALSKNSLSLNADDCSLHVLYTNLLSQSSEILRPDRSVKCVNNVSMPNLLKRSHVQVTVLLDPGEKDYESTYKFHFLDDVETNHYLCLCYLCADCKDLQLNVMPSKTDASTGDQQLNGTNVRVDHSVVRSELPVVLKLSTADSPADILQAYVKELFASTLEQPIQLLGFSPTSNTECFVLADSKQPGSKAGKAPLAECKPLFPTDQFARSRCYSSTVALGLLLSDVDVQRLQKEKSHLQWHVDSYYKVKASSTQ